MNYVKFGNAGMVVSRLCLGCMDFPMRAGIEGSQRILDSAVDHGINFLDTSDSYGRGESETVLGRILQGKRHELVVATKFWVKMHEQQNMGGCSRLHIMQALEESLRRLGTDYIDLYQLHHPDPNTPEEEVFSTLDALVKQGKIRYIGVSNHYAWQMAHILGVSAHHNWEPIVSIQCRYCVTDRAVENETIPFCQRFNIAMMVYGPLDGGILTGKYRRGELPPPGSRLAVIPSLCKGLTDEVYRIVDELTRIADKYGIGVHQLAMAWLLSKPYVTAAILGGGAIEHFEPMYGVSDLVIDPADLLLIDDISALRRYRAFENQPIVQGAPLALNRW